MQFGEHNDYTILKGHAASRWMTVAFSALCILYLAAIGIVEMQTNTPNDWRYVTVYVAPILLILAAILRAYLFYLLSAVATTVHYLLVVLLSSFREGSYTTFDLIDMLVIFTLLAISAALAWQTILFFLGHADNVALTHTSLLFAVLTATMIFFPYMVHLFLEDLYVIDTWDSLLLACSFLAFSHGIERKKPTAPTEETTNS